MGLLKRWMMRQDMTLLTPRLAFQGLPDTEADTLGRALRSPRHHLHD